MSERSGVPLVPTPATEEALLHEAARALRRHAEAVLARSPMGAGIDPRTAEVLPGTPRFRSREAPPEEGMPLEEALREVLEVRAPLAQATTHPGYAAYIAGGAVFPGALAALVAAAVNPYATIHACAPGLAEIEAESVSWLAHMVGLPPGAGGVLLSGGSIATLTALVAAREARLDGRMEGARIYHAADAHHCLAKAARTAGFPREALASVPVHPRTRRMDVLALERMIAGDRASGRRPFLLCATAGTTSTGAIDPLDACAEIARREGLWLHVDAAYGGPFALTAEGARRLRGMERADTIVLDPHKSLSLPYGLGAVLARNPRALRVAHGQEAAYMPPEVADAAGDAAWAEGRVDMADLSPELSRSWRGLALWLPLVTVGVAAFRENLERALERARRIAREIDRLPALETLLAPDLSIVVFAARAGNEATRALLGRLNARGTMYLSGTALDGRAAIRICLLSPRLEEERLRTWLAELEEEALRAAET